MATGFEEGQVKEFADKFKREVANADGKLLSVPGLKSRLGESLFVSARFGEDKVDPEKSYLNVDVFAKRGEEYVPVGIYDWEVVGKKASGNKQRHGHLSALNQAHRSADRYWNSGEAFHVRDDDLLKYATEGGNWDKMTELRQQGIVQDEGQWTDHIYQRRGIGSLMIAVSAIVLEQKGIDVMDLGTLSDSAKATWKKFSQEDGSKCSPNEIVNHAATEKTLIKSLL